MIENSGKRLTKKDCGDLGVRKRLRSGTGQPQAISTRRGADGLGSGVNKTLTIIGNRRILTLTVDPHTIKDMVGVEIHPNERWIGVPLCPCGLFSCLICHRTLVLMLSALGEKSLIDVLVVVDG